MIESNYLLRVTFHAEVRRRVAFVYRFWVGAFDGAGIIALLIVVVEFLLDILGSLFLMADVFDLGE